MDVTDSQLLPFPEGNDPADGALELQVLAEAINAKLIDAFAGFRNVLNNSVYMASLSTNQTGFTNGAIGSINFDTEVYNSTGASNTPSSPFFRETGYFRIGTYIISNPAGGVNANTARFGQIEFRKQLALPPGSVVLEEWITLNWESVQGGEHQVAEGLIRVDSIAPPGSFIQARFTSFNSTSSTNVLANSLIWYYRVSDLEDF